MQSIDELAREHSPTEERPLAGYAGIMAAYGALVAALTAAARLTGRRLPERVSTADLVLLTVATNKISRLIAKDTVTSPVRAPFTRFEEPAGESEVNERPRGHGLQHAVGELVTCPFCVGLWVATGLVGGLVLAPRLTRAVTVVATTLAGSDVLHFGYDALKRSAHQ